MKYRSYKRLWAIFMAAALSISIIGCNGSETQQAAEETSAEETSAAETAETADDAAGEVAGIVITAAQELVSTVNGITDGLCSWTTGGTEAGTINGDDYAFIPVIYINGGVYDTEKSAVGDAAAVTDAETANLNLTIEKTAVNGIIVNNSTHTITGSVINVNASDADGSETCDFSGLGAAIAVYGADSDLTVSDTAINADGVANLAVFVDNGATALLENVTLHSDGGTLYEGYINSPNQGTMVAPPWILGIMGTSRGTNLEGTDSTMTVIDSATSASNWAVLSTDAGSNMYLNVVNTTMDLTGSEDALQADGLYDVENPYTSINGYGTYAIGDAVETFLGTTMNIGTYATIFTGGTGYYGNLTAGESYDLLAADGSVHYTYTAQEDAQTVINSDTFGFMSHQGTNICTIDGATVNSAFTNFLVKSGNSIEINVMNDAVLNAENGILLQLLDNDDSTTEFNPNDETVGMAFGTVHEEYEGFPMEAVDLDESQGDEASSANTAVYNVVDTDLTGAIYNGIGWDANALSQGNVKQTLLDVNLSGAATLTGAIASTSCIHSSYEGQSYLKSNGITAFDDDALAADFASEYQATSFTIAEYFNIGQVANLVKYNGLNDINVTVADSAVWTVTDTSLINALSISGDAQVVVEDGVTLTVGGTEYAAGVYTAADFQ